MTTFADIPVWLILVIFFGAMGPMMRMIFGGWNSGTWPHHKSGKRSSDIARLDAQIAERDVVIEDLQRRINELESRLDFTERLLAERASSLAP